MTFLRSHADDLPLDTWLNTQVFPYEAKLTPEDISVFTKLAILEYLTSGTTAVMEMYLDPETIARTADSMGMRMVQVGGINNFTQPPAMLEKWYRELNGVSPLTSFELGFHAEYTCSRELLEQIAELAHRLQAPVFTHCEETFAETQGCLERYGRTPVALLAELGIWDYGGAGYHLVHTNEEDRAILLEKKVGVVTNPASNAKLASGIAPLSDYLSAGIPVAIGTDGPASNNCLDMFREMFLATALAKLRTGDASAVPAGEVLKMATVSGAHIMRIPDADVLAEGKLAEARELQYAVNEVIYKMCSAHGNMYAVIKEILRINEALDLGGVRLPLAPLAGEDRAICKEAAAMIRAAREKYGANTGYSETAAAFSSGMRHRRRAERLFSSRCWNSSLP